MVMYWILKRPGNQIALHYHLVATAWSGINHYFKRELKELNVILKNTVKNFVIIDERKNVWEAGSLAQVSP